MAMLAVARLTQRADTSGVPQDITPTWSYTSGLATGRFEGPRATIALAAWCKAMPAGYRPSHRTVQTQAGERVEWTVAVTIDDVSVHLIASTPVQLTTPAASRRELVTA
jgi:hypothetical protein